MSPPSDPQLDALGRPILPDAKVQQLRDAFKALPKDAKAALIVIGDSESKSARGHFVANLPGEGWKVAAGGGFRYDGQPRGDGWFAIEKVWGGKNEN